MARSGSRPARVRRAVAALFRQARCLGMRFLFLLASLHRTLKWFAWAVLGVQAVNLVASYVTHGFVFPIAARATELAKAHQQMLLLGGELFVLLYLTSWLGHIMRARARSLQSAFGLCKSAEALTLEDLGLRVLRHSGGGHNEGFREERPFYGKYFPRKMVEEGDFVDADTGLVREFSEGDLEQLLRNGQGFILVDLLYSGKTLTLYHILRRMNGYTVVMPDDSRPVPEESVFAHLKGRKVVVTLDNLPAFAESNYNLELFMRRIGSAAGGRHAVAGTCREGGDFAAIAAGHGNHVTYFCEGLLKLRLHPMTDVQRVQLAATAGFDLAPTEARNYPLPGNITMRDRTRAMVERFRMLPDPEKDALRAMKLLDAGSVPLTVPRLQLALNNVFHCDTVQHPIEHMLLSLWNYSFLLERPSAQKLHPHFGHLVYAVQYPEGPDPEEDRWEILSRALEEARDGEALLHLSHAHDRRGDLVGSLQTLQAVLRIAPERAEAHLHMGQALARLGRLDEALGSNDRALELQPDFAEAHNHRARILSRRGDLPGALDSLRHALELQPKYADAHTNCAIVLARLGRFEEAQQEFSIALDLHPTSYYTYLHLGITLSRQEAFEAALTAFQQALELRPDYPEAYLNRGVTLARMGRLQEALDSHEQAIARRPEYAQAYMHMGQTLANLKRYPEAVQAISHAIELEPDYAFAYVHRARTFGHMGPEFREAAHKDWQKASALGALPEQRALDLAISLGRSRAFAEALALFDRVIELRPDDPQARVNRGITLARMERFEEALADFDHAVDVYPDSPEALMNRAIAFSHMDRFDEALADFDRAIELRPGSYQAHMNRGITLARMDRFDEALADYGRAIELRPLSPEAYMNRAQTLARIDRLDETVADYTRAIELRPDSLDIYLSRATALARLERFDEALADYTYVLERRPEDFQTFMNRGVTLTRMGRARGGLTDFDRAIELHPDSAEAHYQRGRTFALLGRYDKALGCFDRAIELRPGHPEAHCDRGAALANHGRHAEALQEVDLALQLRPEFAEAYFARGFILTTIRGLDRERLRQALQAYEEATRLRPNYPEAHRERGFILGQLGLDEEALAAYNQALQQKPNYAEALFGKARTLCFLARREPARFPVKDCFRKTTELLERAVRIDRSIIRRIAGDRSAFRDLKNDADYGHRLEELIRHS